MFLFRIFHANFVEILCRFLKKTTKLRNLSFFAEKRLSFVRKYSYILILQLYPGIPALSPAVNRHSPIVNQPSLITRQIPGTSLTPSPQYKDLEGLIRGGLK